MTASRAIFLPAIAHVPGISQCFYGNLFHGSMFELFSCASMENEQMINIFLNTKLHTLMLILNISIAP